MMKKPCLVGLLFVFLALALCVGSAAGEAVLLATDVSAPLMETSPSHSPSPAPDDTLSQEALLAEDPLESETPTPDQYGKARAAFLKAKDIFSAIADISEGSLRKNAASAAAAAQDAANAAELHEAKTAAEVAGRAKLDAMLAAATILSHTEVDKAVKGFDTQLSAFAGAPEDQRPEQLAKVAAKLVAVANALQKTVAGDT